MEKRTRSPNYPALSLPAALEKVGVLYKNQHTHSAPREVVAQGMGYNSLNGASATAISALHKYGLLERVGDDLKLSDRAMQILHPHSPDEKAKATRDAASEPQLFAELAERFPGSMPSDDILRNYLIRRGFAPNAVSSVILAFRDTIELVERESGSYDAAPNVPATRESDMSSASQPRVAVATIATGQVSEMKQDERSIARYDFEGGGYVRIIAGGDIGTESALDMAETLLQLKRKEIKARVVPIRVARPAVDDIVEADDGDD